MSIVGISGRNQEQKDVIRSLLNPDYDIIVIDGEVGSGKTLLATAYAMIFLQYSFEVL